MKKSLFIIFLILALLSLSGCFRTQPQSDLLVTLNGSSLEVLKAETEIKDEHIFKSYINRTALKKIVFVTSGETINLEFQGQKPDFVYLTDSILSNDGEYLFGARLDMKVEYTKKDENNYSFIVDAHPTAYMIPATQNDMGIFRGIKIDAFFGEQKTTYLLVIKTAVNK